MTRKTWEYRSDVVGVGGQLDAHLRALGLEGWELVSCIPEPSYSTIGAGVNYSIAIGGIPIVRVFMKRSLEDVLEK